ncbi:uncharacterized protein LOC17890839 [Capsella rubella]|nr:uncharacterized protein LOC17890839 [Capsella rubella]
MSMLLRHVWKEALGRNHSRRFSSSLCTNQPYLILGGDYCGVDLIKGDNVGHLEYYDPCKGEVKVSEKIVPMEFLELMGRIGSSHGWVASLNTRDASMSLIDDLNPTTSLDSYPKRISLPPFVTLPYCQTQLVSNVAMSSASPEQEDCVLAVKFFGPQLSLCKPCSGPNTKWFNIRTPNRFFNSQVMYSRRNQMFCMAASGGHYTGSWDLHKHRHNPILNQLKLQNFPKLMQPELGLLDSCFRREDLVESPTGESFLVKWYDDGSSSYSDSEKSKTNKLFLVFKIDEEGNACYTQDIGDLCIFLSKSEPFCLHASLYSGLTPNSVYFVGFDDIGVCNLATSTVHQIPNINPDNYPSMTTFWLHN